MAQKSYTENTSPYLQQTSSHPRLYITTDKINYIKAKLAEYPYSKFWDITKKKADEYSAEEIPPTINQMSDGTIRQYGDRISFMALAYLLTEEDKYLDGTRRWMNALTSYKNWASNTDLGSAHLLFGMSIAYDWLYDKWSENERLRFRQKISKQASILYRALTKEKVWWTRTEYLMQNHNYTNVMSIAIAGIALQGEAPEVNKWLASAENNFQRVLQLLSPDGASHEGVGYWGYGMESLLKYYLASPKVNRNNLLQNTPYFQNASKFRLYASLPGYKENVDFADSPRFDWYGPGYILRALSSVFKDGHAQWLADRIEKARGVNTTSSWLNLIWFDESVTPIAPDELPAFSYFDNLGIFISRSDWSDDATWVFFKAGPSQGKLAESKGIYTGSHIHPDAGNFLLWAHGEWLIIDDGYTYKKRTENHNVLLFNGIGQLGEGNKWFDPSAAKKHNATSKITHIDLQPEYQYLVAEIDEMYPPEAGIKKWSRSFIWQPPNTLVIHDEINTTNTMTATEKVHFSKPLIKLSTEKACLPNENNTRLIISNLSHKENSMKIAAYKIEQKEATTYSNNSGEVINIALKNNESQTLLFENNQLNCSANDVISRSSISNNALTIKSKSSTITIDFNSRKVTFNNNQLIVPY